MNILKRGLVALLISLVLMANLSSAFNRLNPIRSIVSHMMFSGIVEEMGTVEKLVVNKQMPLWDGTLGEGVELTVVAEKALEDAYIGCSIAINGVCLTATFLEKNKFTVGLAPETLRRTNLGKLSSGKRVNIERALRADGRNSGHFVQGHVDCTAIILEKWKENDSLWIKVKVPFEFIKYIVPKGFICIDGTSLTVCDVNANENSDSWFTFMLISHTQQNVIIPSKDVGDLVNIEVDVLAKMVERSIAGALDKLSTDRSQEVVILENKVSLLTERLSVLEKKLLK